MWSIPHFTFPIILIKAAMVIEVDFREQDQAIRKQKMRKIQCISFVLLLIAICVPIAWQEAISLNFDGIFFAWPTLVFFLMQGLSLVIAVWYLRVKINSISSVYANLKMYILHLVNFIGLLALYLAQFIFEKTAQSLTEQNSL